MASEEPLQRPGHDAELAGDQLLRRIHPLMRTASTAASTAAALGTEKMPAVGRDDHGSCRAT